jgi:hypothetical protein
MAKATHKGTCQVCGSIQMLPSGVLSNHGYTVQWGFFEGVCNGAKALPYEVSTNVIDFAIQRAKSIIQTCKDEIQSLNVQPEAWSYVYSRKHKAYYWMIVELNEDGTKYLNPESNSWESHSYHNDAGMIVWNGVDEIKYEMSKLRIKELNNKIKKVKEYIQWQENRIKNWEPKPLIER